MLNTLLSGLLVAFSTFGVTTRIESEICSAAPPTPVISSPVDGARVTAGGVYVNGTAESGNTVSLLVDNVAQVSTTASPSGDYGMTVQLADGDYVLKTVATNACGSSISSPITIGAFTPPPPAGGGSTSAPTAPVPSTNPASRPTTALAVPNSSAYQTTQSSSDGLTLYIDKALDGSSVEADSVYVSGSLSKDGRVTIKRDGTVFAAQASDSSVFGFTIPLILGENTFTIVAQSGDSVAEKTITITRTGAADQNNQSQSTNSTTALEKSMPTPWYKNPVIIGTAGFVVAGLIGGAATLQLAVKKRRSKDE